jgi:hypothetical protein
VRERATSHGKSAVERGEDEKGLHFSGQVSGISHQNNKV